MIGNLMGGERGTLNWQPPYAPAAGGPIVNAMVAIVVITPLPKNALTFSTLPHCYNSSMKLKGINGTSEACGEHMTPLLPAHITAHGIEGHCQI